MEVSLKLALFSLVNLLALGMFIVYMLQRGFSYRQALRLAWERIIFHQNKVAFDNAGFQSGWSHWLKWTWRLMMLLYFLRWLISDMDSGAILLVILIFHGYWYFHAHVQTWKMPERILFTHDDWGVIYLEVVPGSGFNEKSLAELDLRKKNLLVLAVEREGRMLPFPKGIEILRPGDRILLFGEFNSYHTVHL